MHLVDYTLVPMVGRGSVSSYLIHHTFGSVGLFRWRDTVGNWEKELYHNDTGEVGLGWIHKSDVTIYIVKRWKMRRVLEQNMSIQYLGRFEGIHPTSVDVVLEWALWIVDK